MTAYIDTHAHLFLCKQPLDTLVENAQNANVSTIINVATNLENAQKTKAAAQQYSIIKATAGYYPSEAVKSPSILELEQELASFPYVAIGEIGMDFYHDYGPEDQQASLFIAQLELARKLKLPVIIHNRHADNQMAPILTKFKDVTKVIHCFSSDISFIEKIDSPSTYYSFTGIITYAKKGKTIQAIRHLPLEKIMIETDSPYLTPIDHKGNANEPAFVPSIAQKIAKIKDISIDDVSEITTRTAKKFFNIV